jgi:type IV fimbrial biogenesis protein FimT
MKKKNMKQNLKTKNGFTLIELLVTLVILGILLAAGVPGMQNLLANMSVRSSTDKLINSLAYARGEAVARGANVSVRSTNTTVPVTLDEDWSDGWEVFVDSNADCTWDAAIAAAPPTPAVPEEEMLRVVDISAENLSVLSINTVSLPGSDATSCVGFNALGENRASTGSSLTLSAPNATAKTITVSPAGYTR